MLKNSGDMKSCAVIPLNKVNIVNNENVINKVPVNSCLSLITSCWKSCVKDAVATAHVVIELVKEDLKNGINAMDGLSEEAKQEMIDIAQETLVCLDKALPHEVAKSEHNTIIDVAQETHITIEKPFPHEDSTDKSSPRKVTKSDHNVIIDVARETLISIEKALPHEALTNGGFPYEAVKYDHNTTIDIAHETSMIRDKVLPHGSLPKGASASLLSFNELAEPEHNVMNDVAHSIWTLRLIDKVLPYVSSPGGVSTHGSSISGFSPGGASASGFSLREVAKSDHMYLTHIASPRKVVVHVSDHVVVVSGDMRLTLIASPNEVVIELSERDEICASGDINLTSEQI